MVVFLFVEAEVAAVGAAINRRSKQWTKRAFPLLEVGFVDPPVTARFSEFHASKLLFKRFGLLQRRKAVDLLNGVATRLRAVLRASLQLLLQEHHLLLISSLFFRRPPFFLDLLYSRALFLLCYGFSVAFFLILEFLLFDRLFNLLFHLLRSAIGGHVKELVNKSLLLKQVTLSLLELLLQLS